MSVIEEKYRGIVGAGVAAASGVAVPGLFVPALDMAGVGATWTTMVAAIAKKSGLSLNTPTTAKIVASSISAVSAYVIGSKILTWAAAPLVVALPVAGIPAVVALNVALNGLFTLRLGVVCSRHFSRAGFSDGDAARLGISIGTHLLGWPTADEIRLVKELLSA